MTTSALPTRAGVPRRHGSVRARATLGSRVTRRAVQVVGWSVVLAVSAAVLVAVAVPRLGGGTPYTILTGSMAPDLPPGTLVVVRPVAAAEIGVGSVITYQLESGKPAVVTHRVVEAGQDRDGTPHWRTRGDANRVADADWVTPVQVRGELWYSVPRLGRVNVVLDGAQRHLATVLVAVALLAWALALWAGALRDRRRRVAR